MVINTATLLFLRKKSCGGEETPVHTAGYICVTYLIASLIFCLLYPIVLGSGWRFALSDSGMVPAVITVALTALCVSVIVKIYEDFYHVKEISVIGDILLLILELPLLLLFYFRLRVSEILHSEINISMHMVTFVTTFLAMNAAAFLIIKQTENALEEQEMEEMRNKMELEHMHFERAQERRQQLYEIQNEYDTLLARTSSLIDAGRVDDALNFLGELTEKIESTREEAFCRIAAVNAILEMKKRECEQYNITLQADVMLPAALSVKDIDLCMAFGNLLDNAIRECKKVRGGV